MRMLLLSPLPPPAGGIATWTENYCKYMHSVGHTVWLVNTAVRGQRSYGEQKKRLSGELKRIWDILCQTHRTLQEEHIDYVHINTSCSPAGLLRDILCMLLAKRHLLVLHCHCNVEDQVGKSRLGKHLLTFAVRKADRVLVLNEKSLHYVQTFGCTKVQILPNFTDLDAVTSAHIARENIKRILFVGHVRREKGLFELLEAASSFPEISFELVGPVHEDLKGIRVPSNVHLLGTQAKESVVTLLGEADVFLFPSYSEGFSMALLEAMAAGLPCIATDVGANRDMLEDRGGILIPAKDPRAIVDAIEKLRQPGTREAMSAWNQKKVRETYTVDRVMTQLLRRMQELTA